MPRIPSRQIGIALDMRGCPNRCRHCYLGNQPSGAMTADDLRWAAGLFRDYVKPGESRPFIERLTVSSWVREPDYGDNYRELAQLEAQLSDGPPARYELLSVWRLARDPAYPAWARVIGPDTCQITFFGVGATQDWFCRRAGAFDDCILATQRLLDAGMKPRWQLFLTKKIIPELGQLMEWVERLKLRERVAALGGEFVMFVHAPMLVGEGRRIAHLSATLEDTKQIPAELAASSMKHFKTDKLWTTEGDVVSAILSGAREDAVPYAWPDAGLWLCILPNWDVIPNMGHGEAWWRLGNLKSDPIELIFDRFENDRLLPLSLNHPGTLRELALRYGDPASDTIVSDIEQYWAEMRCAELFRS